MTLLECFNKYGCDKGFWHRYDLAYEPLFEPLRDAPITLLEIGILRGQSLLAWADYFPQADIVGVDTFERLPARNLPTELLTHPRITWHKMDSTIAAPNVAADIIIDDGNHIQEAQLKTFQNYMPQLKDGGAYFIEDFLPFDDKQEPWLNTKYPENTEAGHDRLIKALTNYQVTPHDLREYGQPTSYMLEIRHGA